jgi:hypothetical protein
MMPCGLSPGCGSTRGSPVEIGAIGPFDWVAHPARIMKAAKNRLGVSAATRDAGRDVIQETFFQYA